MNQRSIEIRFIATGLRIPVSDTAETDHRAECRNSCRNLTIIHIKDTITTIQEDQQLSCFDPGSITIDLIQIATTLNIIIKRKRWYKWR